MERRPCDLQVRVAAGAAIVTTMRHPRWLGLWLALAVPGTPGLSLAQPVSFQGLGDLPGGAFRSEARGVSNSCGSVVGESESDLGTEGFRWLVATGVMWDLHGASATTTTTGNDISGDGIFAVGSRSGEGGRVAKRWRLGETSTTWTSPPGLVWNGVNEDGSVPVGTDGSLAYYDPPGFGGVMSLGDLPGGGTASSAFGISEDATTIVGQGSSANGDEAFRWTETEGMVGLGDLPGGAFSSVAYAVSPDGSVIVGSSEAAGGVRAFRWTPGAGMKALVPLPPGTVSSVARDVSGDGRRVVGALTIDGVGTRAMIWESFVSVKETKLVQQVLEDAGLELTGWTLTDAASISRDGRCVAGTGVNPAGDTEAWLAKLPEVIAVPALPPGAVRGGALLVTLGAFLTAFWRTKKGRTRRARSPEPPARGLGR
jgi:probable HAF family extracellular repeat protein